MNLPTSIRDPAPPLSVPIARNGAGPAAARAMGWVPDLIARAGRTSFWPLADQAVVSAGNFLTLVFVARALPAKSEYGLFGLLLECIFYLNMLQGALVIFPLTVIGATANRDGQRRLATASLLLTGILALPVVCAALGVAALSDRAMLGLAGAFALIMWQVQEVSRRSLAAQFRYAAAVPGDALRYLGTAAAVWVMWRSGAVSVTGVFFVVGSFAGLAVIVQSLQVGLCPIGRRDLVELAREFWRRGNWLLLTSLGALLTALCGVGALALFHGTASVGDFYAIANFNKPVNPIIVTFGALVAQHAAKAYASGGAAASRRVALRLAAITATLTVPYLLALVAVPRLAIRLLYGAQSHFLTPAGVTGLRLFILGFVIFIALSLLGSFLNGIGRTRDTFRAQLVNAAATVAITLPLTMQYGLIGMIVGGAAAAAVQLAVMLYLFRKAT